ncbi:hypothetical protein FB480_103115 [Agrobacterium vitis]|nr:hypothetical protein FB480_103115 [Agrobacterium vitis]
MKLVISFGALDGLMHKMGAVPVNWRLGGAGLSPREIRTRELVQGKEISIEELGQFGGLLEHDGEQVLLYIKDTKASRNVLLNEPERTKRFHIAECATLRDMREKGRFQRYHITKRFDGKFNCTWFDRDNNQSGEIEAELKVCKNCIQQIGWNGYDIKSPNQDLWKNFDIAEFLRTYETIFYSKPERNDAYTVTADYVRDWPKVSQNYRQSRGWRCDDCGVNLSEHRKLLHTHHIDGNLGNNRHDNFKALCVLCHEQQPFHAHMKGASSKYRSTIEALRVVQR